MNVSALLPVSRPTSVQPTFVPPQTSGTVTTPAYETDGLAMAPRSNGGVPASTVTFLSPGYATVQVVSLLRMAHDAATVRDAALAKTAYTRAIFVSQSTDDFAAVVEHAASHGFHQTAREALFAGKGHTQDLNNLMRLADLGAHNGYRTETTDIYQTAIAACGNFYQLNTIANRADSNGYPEPARQARLKAISLAGH